MLSSNKSMFDRNKEIYQQALEKSGYKHVLEYIPYVDKKENSATARIREVVWFNPPWDSRVKTNVGRIVLESFKRNIPARHELHHIFNKNTIKV